MGKLISDVFAALPLDIEILSQCEREILDIVRGYGIESTFADDLDLRIRFLEKYKKQASRIDRKKFWKTKGQKHLYEIRFKREINLRIIYTFKDNIAILICAFSEKTSDADYKRYIKISNSRVKSIE